MSEGPTIRQLRYFLSAVDHGSLSAAADYERVAQPSLSEQVRRLERELGSALFIRTNRDLRLTDLGRAMIPMAREAVRATDAVAESASAMTTLSGGRVSFGTFSSAHRYLLNDLITEFNTLYPQVRIRNVGLNSSEVVQAVRTGELEAGLVQLPVDTRGVHLSETVLTDTVVCVSSDVSQLRTPVTIDDLAKTRLILSESRWEKEDPLRREVTRLFTEAGLSLSPLVEVEFQDAALALALNGVGDTLVSYLVTCFHEQSYRIKWAPLEPVFKERYAFVSSQAGSLSPATRRFLALARKHAQRLQVVADRWEEAYYGTNYR
ncbi:LysR family transcriptional regulator [Curtobacterium sp. S6]|uniref:LysR family transcriptional regulator n=1 Tax=Curtobacterium sp. S6 TaxID=1479623 RepID=UPI00068B5072|nr:LysR family transcriptional regulator [Curtobacterium sp. S6]